MSEMRLTICERWSAGTFMVTLPASVADAVPVPYLSLIASAILDAVVKSWSSIEKTRVSLTVMVVSVAFFDYCPWGTRPTVVWFLLTEAPHRPR